MDNKNFQVGINLGGWLSQYRAYDQAHFQSFITEADIAQIAAWGMDHVRLPVDYPVIQTEIPPYEFIPSGLGYIRSCLQWCKQHGLGLILDLHKAPGFFFGTLQSNDLFSEPAQQERFFNIWRELTRQFKEEGDNLVFELLNELVLPSSDPWNRLARQTVEAIRAIDSQRWIIIGGNNYNSAPCLPEVTVLEDARVAYTFHFYEPMPVTHQKAAWVPALMNCEALPYPCPPLAPEFFPEEYREKMAQHIGQVFDRNFLLNVLQPALEFQQKTGRIVYCGEFGVIDQAPLATRVNWNREFVALLNENKIGRAYWSYKQMDFGLVNQAGELISQKLLESVCRV
jgi:aryl-phospho-beta-D-glucosidase BglC (GH1 family)